MEVLITGERGHRSSLWERQEEESGRKENMIFIVALTHAEGDTQQGHLIVVTSVLLAGPSKADCKDA